MVVGPSPVPIPPPLRRCPQGSGHSEADGADVLSSDFTPDENENEAEEDREEELVEVWVRTRLRVAGGLVRSDKVAGVVHVVGSAAEAMSRAAWFPKCWKPLANKKALALA